jgi:hypothetical protein
MRRIAYVLLASTVLMLAHLGGVCAQNVPADITVISVLTMAKEEAEKAPDEESRTTLRWLVAMSLQTTGHMALFGSYIDDLRKAQEQRESVKAQRDDIDKFNFEVEANAKRAFLSGDIDRAKEILGQCRHTGLAPSRCGNGEWGFLTGPVDSMLFIRWEIEHGRMDAAFHRLKTIEWLPELRAINTVGVGAYVAAGNREKILELRQLAEAAGGKFDSCIMTPPSSRLMGDFPSLESAAVIRKMACDGQARAALDRALSETDLGLRTRALCVVAEGLAGIPGVSFEPLKVF